MKFLAFFAKEYTDGIELPFLLIYFATQMKQLERIVFFGTPMFAANILDTLVMHKFPIVAVVTAPDKAAGRGMKASASAVKQIAEKHQIPVLQPEKLKSEAFVSTLQQINADLNIVIAFRMLPEVVWQMPRLGTMNLHASLLPAYRGAAPINWAIINGETQTGLSTFFLKHAIDTGNVLLQKTLPILEEDNAGSLHDKMMIEGAQLVVDSLNSIETGKYQLTEQVSGNFPHAPKLNNDNCQINWQLKASTIHNLIRGLSPYPSAYCRHNNKMIKLFKSKLTELPSVSPGKFEIINKHHLMVHCADYCLEIIELQLEGKKRMQASEFINGFQSII